MASYTKNRVAAFAAGKCPQCQTGRIFKSSAFSLQFREVHETCPHCGVKFQSEPGFFWGAMYFSYGIMVGICIIVGIVLYTIMEEPPMLLGAAVIVGTALVLMPVNLRLSRLLLIYIAAPYRRFKKEKV